MSGLTSDVYKRTLYSLRLRSLSRRSSAPTGPHTSTRAIEAPRSFHVDARPYDSLYAIDWEAHMYTYVESVGLMETADHTALLRIIKKVGRGKFQPLPFYESDIPREAVLPLEAELESLGLELLSDALAGILRPNGVEFVMTEARHD